DQKELFEFFKEKALQRYQLIENSLRDKGIEMRELESFWTRQVIDERWKDHLYEMDQLKEGIGLRAYGQKDPLIEYKSEAYRMFTELLDMINEQVLARILRPLIPHDTMLPRRGVPQQARTVHDSTVGMGFTVVPQESAKRSDETTVRREKKQPVVVGEKIGRNDPCPCGSGKKYKKCCGAL
ncbi:MAG: SEC-C metal-binding domain-containing protein, partial [bacterium]